MILLFPKIPIRSSVLCLVDPPFILFFCLQVNGSVPASFLPEKPCDPYLLYQQPVQQAASLNWELIGCPAKRSSLQEIQGCKQTLGNLGLALDPEVWSYSLASSASLEPEEVSCSLPGLTPEGKEFLLSVPRPGVKIE